MVLARSGLVAVVPLHGLLLFLAGDRPADDRRGPVSNWTDAQGRLCPERRAPDPMILHLHETLQAVRNELADREAMLRHVMQELRSVLSALESVVTR